MKILDARQLLVLLHWCNPIRPRFTGTGIADEHQAREWRVDLLKIRLQASRHGKDEGSN
jgi:hypothetical protein